VYPFCSLDVRVRIKSIIPHAAFFLQDYTDITLIKEYYGTVLVTSIGMFGEGSGWGIPVPNHTLQLTRGGIFEKPGVVDSRIEVREYLSVTISFDHDIVDGAPAARFTQRLKELIESGFGLRD
jgi:pyruvate/2-oxoglutarate dehydrogenase complex dihydrolipoamide acyltransferase (E2) component